MARRTFLYTFTPLQTYCIETTEEDGSKNGMRGGGNIINAFHGIPGRRAVKDSIDAMEWYMGYGPDPDHDKFVYREWGVQPLKNVYSKLRVNVDQRLRYTDEEGSTNLHNVKKENLTQHVFFSGEQTASIKEADTADQLGVDVNLDITFEKTFFVRATVKLADPHAYLTSKIERQVNFVSVGFHATELVGGENVQVNRQRLADAILSPEFVEEILDDVGITITSVSIRDVKMPEEQRKLLQRKIEAETEGEAMLILAKKKRDSDLALLEVDVKRVNEVMLPMTKDTHTEAVMKWESIRNSNLTTYVDGNSGVVLPLPTSKETKEKVGFPTNDSK